ncbi:hypothetical protein PISL3812_08597 [Talaromyces islandicus]|uniref:Uncharacterized protein n=1 Tax=Talaromyces islandicus TaxID=28573 RepID=A0A0U1M7J9_TALIS|nr:hypothetical protein PISL3812_08597 [Talaromyces islandicus]
MDRTQFTPAQSVAYLWRALNLPEHALESLNLVDNDDDDGGGDNVQQNNNHQQQQQSSSSFKIAHLAQSCIALAGLVAATVYSTPSSTLANPPAAAAAADDDTNHDDDDKGVKRVPRVTVSSRHALAEFSSERIYTLNNGPPESSWGRIGGLYQTAPAPAGTSKDACGYVRIHDAFAKHENAALALLGIDPATTPSRQDVARQVARWDAVDLETEGIRHGAVIAALRSYQQWDSHPQARAVADLPVIVRKLNNSNNNNTTTTARTTFSDRRKHGDRCLRGLRVLELSRVIAAPVAGRTLAAHGADVLWVTTASLADQPALDRDLARGKRSVRLDFKEPGGRATLVSLIRDADVLIQSYRPGSLDAYGLGVDDVARINPGIVYASLSAYGNTGPWSQRRGFDSLVQTCSGMNVSEAEHTSSQDPARALPCQALDHASGYFLATGIMAAVYHQLTSNRNTAAAYEVQVSLAGTMKWLRSLGQYPSAVGCANRLDNDLFESRMSAFGELRAVRHAAQVDGAMPGFDVMPRPLGSDEPRWLA